MKENHKEERRMFAKELELIKTSIKVDFAYLADAWGAFIVTLFQIFVFYYIWKAVYNVDDMISGISKDKIVTYLILSRVIYTQITYGLISKLGRIIHTGAISIELLRPVNFIPMMFCERLGDFAAFAAMTAIPTLIICAFTLGIDPPKDFLTLILFGISLVLGMAISFFFDFCVGLLTFYTNYSWGLQTFQEAFIALFSGALIPIAFFPHWLRVITDLLPFQQMSYSPVSIYLGTVTGGKTVEIILSQILWLAVCITITHLFFSF